MTNYVNHFRVSVSRVLVMAALAIGIAAQAQAQSIESKMFLDVRGGLQVGSGTLDSDTTQEIYNETAAIATRHEIGNAGLFDLGFGYRWKPQFGFGVSLSGAQTTYNGSVAARIPDPIFVNRPVTKVATVEDLTRREIGVHVQALWFTKINESLDLTVGIGPSFISVKQPIILVNVIQGTQDLAISVDSETGMVPSINIGADVLYSLNPTLGIGAFGRFTGGSTDFDAIDNVSTTSGQFGVSLRVNF